MDRNADEPRGSERVAEAVRSGALLATVGASLALFAQEMLLPRSALYGLVSKNQLQLSERHRFLLVMGGAALLLALPGCVLLLWGRKETVTQGVRNIALIASPLALLGPARPLFGIRLWANDPLLLGCAIGVIVLIFERLVGRSLESIPARFWTRCRRATAPIATRYRCTSRSFPFALVLLLAAATAYAAFVAILTIRYHDRLGSTAFDLGLYDNIFYNTLHGRPLRGTVEVPSGETWSHLRVHAELSTFAFLPFYALCPRAETLLCIQAFMVAFGAVPIYLFSARRLPPTSALVIAVAYLLFAPIHSANFYDFHFQPLASTLILWCFYALDSKRNILFAIVFLLALGCREDVSISLAVAGMLMLASGQRPFVGLAVAVIGGFYFAIVRFVVMPRFGSWWFQDMYKDLVPAGDATLLGVVKTIASNPLYTFETIFTRDKVLHVIQIFLPLAFLPLRRPCLWLGFLPAILGTILTTGYHPTTDSTFQYIFYWVPFIFIWTPLVLEQIAKERGPARHAAAVLALGLATFLTSLHWGAILQRQTFASAWGHINLEPLTSAERRSADDLRELGDMVSQTASVALSENENAHFSNRLTAYALKLGLNNADYVLYSSDSGRGGAVQAAAGLASGRYERIAERGKFILLKRVEPLVEPMPSARP